MTSWIAKPDGEDEQQTIQWLHNLAPWTHAVTLTFKRHNGHECWNKQVLEAALRHFLRLLDVKCYGKKQAKFVQSAVVVGFGVYENHPHAHLSLACPPEILSQEFDALINWAANKTTWIDKERTIEPYRDSGWSSYMLDHGTENLIYSLLRPVSPSE